MFGKSINREGILGPDSTQVIRKHSKTLGRLGAMTCHLDFAIDNLSRQPNIHHAPEQHVKYLLQRTIDSAHRTLDEVNPFEQERSWNDWYRLQARVGFAPKLVLARHAFARYDMDRRQEVAYGSGDIATAIVENALENRNDDRMDNQSYSRISGVISEYTGIAVANYIEDGGRIALPSSFRDDIARQIDGSYYWTDAAGNNLHTYTQTKSMQRSKGEARLYAGTQKERQPEKVIYFYADDFDNVNKNGKFKMSNLLVEHLRDQSDKEETKPEIEKATIKLWNIVQANWTDQNTIDISIFD